MTPARFGVHVLVVLILMVAVTWPRLGEVRRVSAWRSDGTVDGRRDRTAADASQNGRAGGRVGEFGVGTAAYHPSLGSDAAGLRRRLDENDVEGRRRRQTPAAVLALGGKLNAILGHARTALNAPMPYARLALRNLTNGVVEARATANESGQFVFLDVFPSGYVVELIGTRGDVVATSETLAIDIGDLRETTVRGTSETALKALFGSMMEATASEAVSAASRDGVTQVTAPDRCVSPPCDR
jgi:hypothetical protein